MQNKATQSTWLPTKTIAWFLSFEHVVFGLFNLLWCLTAHHKPAGYTYLAFILLSLVYKMPYLTSALLAIVAGSLLDYFLV